jgi:hypothetical protein
MQTFNHYLRRRFGERVQRVAIHTGLSCPNRDGVVAREPCIYCDNRAINPLAGGPAPPVARQLEEGVRRAQRRYGARKFIAYFQTFTATHAPPERLRSMWAPALAHTDVVGLAVATRPDALPDPVIALLAELARQSMVWVEIGVQSTHDPHLRWLRRGHDWEQARQAIHRCRQAGCLVAAQMILGLPGETLALLQRSGAALREAGIQAVKLHQLHAVRGTPLARLHQQGLWEPLTAEAYVEHAVELLAGLPPDTVIMRFAADCPEELLLAPRWELNKAAIRERIISALEKRGTSVLS